MPTLLELLNKALEDGASDMHLVPGLSPLYRKNTVLAPADDMECTVIQVPERLEQSKDPLAFTNLSKI